MDSVVSFQPFFGACGMLAQLPTWSHKPSVCERMCARVYIGRDELGRLCKPFDEYDGAVADLISYRIGVKNNTRSSI
jgi:hypothetical protein